MTPKGPSGRGPHRLSGPDTSHRGCVLTRLSVLHGVRNGKPWLILPGLLGLFISALDGAMMPCPIGPSNTAWAVLGIGSYQICSAQATNIPIRPYLRSRRILPAHQPGRELDGLLAAFGGAAIQHDAFSPEIP